MFFIMIVFLVLVIIRPQEYPGVAETLNLPLLPGLLAAAVVAWLLSSRKSFAAPQYVLLLAFLVALMMSRITTGWMGGALMVLERFGLILLAFVLLANAAHTRARIVMTMAVFSLCAVVLALHGIDQARTGIGWTGVPLSQGTRIQYVGIFNDPNDLGLLFAMCLPMTVFLGARGGMMGLRRLFWWSMAGILLYGIYLTNSRGTLLAVVATVGVYVWLRRGVMAASVCGAVALMGAMLLPSRLADMDVSESSAMGRVESWYHGIQMFMSRPLFGIGAGGYSDEYQLTAHNSFVLVLAESGIVGYTIWVAFVGYCVMMLFASIKPLPAYEHDEDPVTGDAAVPAGDDDALAERDEAALQDWLDDRAVAMTLLLSLSGFMASAFFLSRSYVVILYLLAALITAHYVAMQKRHAGLPEFKLTRDLVRWPVWSLISVVGLYVTVKVLLALT